MFQNCFKCFKIPILSYKIGIFVVYNLHHYLSIIGYKQQHPSPPLGLHLGAQSLHGHYAISSHDDV